MDSNTYSIGDPAGLPARPSAEPSDGLAALAAAIDQLAAQDLHGLPDAVRAERVLGLRRLLDRLEGHWLQELAGVDARGAAGADQDGQFGSTASWLRARLRMGAGAAHTSVRTARALFRGPLPQTATALTDGQLSPAHARVLAVGTQDLPAHLTAEAEPVLVEVARRLDPARLRQLVAHLGLVADPDGAEAKAERHHQRRGLWLAATLEGMVAVDGLLEAEAGQTLMSALEPLARPASAADARSGGQRRADALAELARRALEAGRLPQTGGVRPQLTVLVELDSLTGHPGTGSLGGDTAGGPLDPEACRRLACDGAVTRVLVTRHPGLHGHHHPGGHRGHPDPDGDQGLTARLRAAAALLAPVLGGAPSQPLDVGRTSRVVSPPNARLWPCVTAAACSPTVTAPLGWCEAHHLWHWLHGGPTDLSNLALVCRAHHRVVHEGGWRLQRQPDGRLTATPPHRSRPRPPAAA
jgi:hypothetical protein